MARMNLIKSKVVKVRALHTMAEGRKAVNFHQSYCKKPRVRPLNPSHQGQSPKVVAI
jgi:hypothetical protein